MSLSARLTAAMVALVLVTAAAVGALNYFTLQDAILPRALERIDTHVRSLAAELESYVSSVQADVLASRSDLELEGIMRARASGGIDPLDGVSEAVWRERLAARYVSQLQVKPAYALYRFFGSADGGREIVRVDRFGPGGAIRVVAASDLQSQNDRDYFIGAMDRPFGETYVSPIDLRRVYRKLSVPHVPVLRVATAVANSEGQRIGFVIVNIDLRSVFDSIRSSAREGSQVYLVNEDGDYLIHPDPAREFGFVFAKPYRWQRDFPALAAASGGAESHARFVRNAAGEQVGAALTWTKLAGVRPVAVIETVPAAVLMAAVSSVERSSLLAAIAAALCAMIIAIFVARSLTRPLVQITRAVEGFARNEAIAVPVNAGGEIGVLARAFSHSMNEVREKSAALERAAEDRRHTQTALQHYSERERLFSAAVESSNDAIVTESLDGVITGWNQAAERLYGYSAQEAIGQKIAIIVPEDRRDELQSILERVTRGEKIDHHDTVRMARDGRRIDVSLSVSPIRLPTGEIVGAAKAAHDITDNKRTQEALRESELMARGIVETALDAFVQLDEPGRILEWSPQAEALLGWSRERAIGAEFSDLVVSSAGLAGFTAWLEGFQHGTGGAGIGTRYELDAQARDGQKLKVELSLTAFRRRDRFVFNIFVRDLTDKLAAEEQLRQSQKMDAIGQLTGGVAHDFNNILTVITGTIEILADAVADKPRLASIAKMIDEAAERGSELTRRLLAFARRQPLQPRVTDINGLVVETAKLLRPTLGEHVEIRSILEDDASPAFVDPNELMSALINIALNARDALPNGGKLIFETGNVFLDETYAASNDDVRPGPYVMIAATDNGKGIPAAIREKVFEPFFTTKSLGKGTGLGLSMVYGFVKQSGGHVKIYSEEGHGTTIRIYLPQTTDTVSSTAEQHPIQAASGGHETILVVEDDDLVRGYVVAQLQSLGYATLAVSSAAEALSIVDGGAAFDLLFTDIIMAGPTNGRQLADEVVTRRPHMRVLFTSGYTENAIVHHGRLDPGVLLIAKPYRKSDLARMVRAALSGLTPPSKGPPESG